jgi:hypothetical protein
MIVVDSSALIAIFENEADAAIYAAVIRHAHCVRRLIVMRSLQTRGEVRLDDGKRNIYWPPSGELARPDTWSDCIVPIQVANNVNPPRIWAGTGAIWRMPVYLWTEAVQGVVVRFGPHVRVRLRTFSLALT